MKLVDIKRTEADRKAEKKRYEEPMDGDDYPYGLKLRLDNATIKKLGLGDLDAEQEVTISAKGFVSDDSVMKRKGKTHRSMEIQITRMALTHGESNDQKAEAMYGQKKGK